MALDKFQPYLFVSAGEQSNKYLTPVISPEGIASFQAQRAQDLTGLTVRIGPIQEGSGDPSPTNIRPISGRTGLTVTRAGKNLCPSKTISMGGTNERTLSIDLPYTIPAGEYIMSYTVGGTGTGGWGLNFYYDSTRVGVLDTGTGRVTMSAPTNRIYAYMAQADYNAGYTRIIDNIQLELGTVVTAYTPYVAPSVYPITWETEAGTVYGGTLDVVSGVLTVNRFFKAFDGTEDWARTGSIGANTNRYYIQWGNMGITGNVINLSDSVCSHLVFLSGNVGQFGTFNASTTNFAVKDGNGTQFADMAAFKAWLAAQNTNGTPLQLCVELATPQTYQLSPTEVMTLAGFNQVYSDAGPVIDIKF